MTDIFCFDLQTFEEALIHVLLLEFDDSYRNKVNPGLFCIPIKIGQMQYTCIHFVYGGQSSSNINGHRDYVGKMPIFY